MLPFFAMVAPSNPDLPRVARPASRLREADKAQLRALYQTHHEVVWRVLRRSGLDAARADDGVQQVFLVALRRLSDLVEGRERAFLCATALMVARKWRLSPQREIPTDDLPEEAGDRQPDDDLELRQQRATLDRVLSAMEEPLREVFVLQEIEGLTKRETALALGLPEGTVATRLRRAREAFQARLQAESGAKP